MSTLAPPSKATLDLGFLAMSGRDAEPFLNGQLSQRVPPAGGPHAAALAAWHDPQGRVRCLCRVLWTGAAYVLLLERPGLSPLARQLQRYALRAELHFESLSEWRALAVFGTAAGSSSVGRPDMEAYEIPIGPDLSYFVGPAAAVAAALEPLPAADPADIARAEIRLGLPALDFWTEPKYVGQMLNLDRLGAIGFDKGCYPGQEILTRVNRLGSVKRRLHRYRGEGSVQPAVGGLLLDARNQAIGEVLRVAGNGGHFELLAVVPGDLRDQALRCETPPVALERLPLPTDEPD